MSNPLMPRSSHHVVDTLEVNRWSEDIDLAAGTPLSQFGKGQKTEGKYQKLGQNGRSGHDMDLLKQMPIRLYDSQKSGGFSCGHNINIAQLLVNHASLLRPIYNPLHF
ncbi:hypothetical protein Ancab_004526 [Ancistrocladus abbreviatus]